MTEIQPTIDVATRGMRRVWFVGGASLLSLTIAFAGSAFADDKAKVADTPTREEAKESKDQTDAPAADELSPRATLSITSEPAGCNVFLDGRMLMGADQPMLTPLELKRTPHGKYSISLAKRGYKDLTFSYRLDERAKPAVKTLKKGDSALLASTGQEEIHFDQLVPTPIRDRKLLQKRWETLADIVKASGQRRMDLDGGTGKVEFLDNGPTNGAMVGVKVWFDAESSTADLVAIQPIYGTPSGKKAGDTYGVPKGMPETIEAIPGYVVVDVLVKYGWEINAVQLRYAALGDKGLNRQDLYRSLWVGAKTEDRRVASLGGDGSPVIGLAGKLIPETVFDDPRVGQLGIVLAAKP